MGQTSFSLAVGPVVGVLPPRHSKPLLPVSLPWAPDQGMAAAAMAMAVGVAQAAAVADPANAQGRLTQTMLKVLLAKPAVVTVLALVLGAVKG